MLNPREAEALGYVALGLQNKQIAWEMGITEHTVKCHVKALKRKLGCRNRVELALRAHGIEI